MIDFRYHLVSLASVLIALSVGIVLGAGPLNDDIGNTLSGEVTKLRGEKEELRRQLGDSDRGTEGRDTFDEAYLPRVVAGRLVGQEVAVVALPQAEDSVVEDISDTLQDAGASVTEPVVLDELWVRGGAATTSTGDRLLGDLGIPADTVEEDGNPLDLALGAVLVGRAGEQQVDESARRAAWERLDKDGFVTSPADLPPTADLVVLVGAPVATQDDEAETTRQAESWVRLARTLDVVSSGAVLAGSQGSSASEDDVSVVTTARADGRLSDGISTVDVPEVPMGRATVVLALAEQLEGENGHYGLGPDATAPVPDVP